MPPLLLSPSAAAPPPPPLRLVNPEDDDIAVWKWTAWVCWAAGRMGPEFVGRNDSIANRQGRGVQRGGQGDSWPSSGRVLGGRGRGCWAESRKASRSGARSGTRGAM